ncbi:mechanosensitive ion channel domain-containing protein [Algoriphagus limi]|uniref:Mechanosensitive ion channel n=1 Tax=Algoriphagus limi TaxID=2975273 RepID=A0ABT2G9F2_9BACT|nr:mechanosensitive ion channel domain-containing protein [Algoriphagus limi]MCS5491908.1 mechanosensitive ion channel [Algoriphagus limi]
MKRLLILSFLFSTFFFFHVNPTQSQDLNEAINQLLPDSSEVQEEGTLTLQNIDLSEKDIRNEEIGLGKILSQLYTKTNQYSITISKIKVSLQEPLDTAEMMENLPSLESVNNTIELLFQDTLRKDNVRYLKGISSILKALLEEIGKYETVVADRSQLIIKANEDLSKIKSDTLLNLDKSELEIVPGLYEQMERLKTAISDLEEKIYAEELALTQLQVKLSQVNFSIISNDQYFRLKNKETNRNIWKKESNFLWEKRDENFGSKKSTWDIIYESFFANTTFVLIFLGRNIVKIVLFFLTWIFMSIWMKRIVKSIKSEKDHSITILSRSNSINNHPIISAFIVITPFFFVFFDNPPIPFNSGISFVFALAASWLIKDYFPKSFQTLWWIFLPVSLLGPTIGLNWAQNYNERFILLATNIIGIIFGIIVIQKYQDQRIKGKKLLLFLAVFLIVIEVIALSANVFGRISVAKLLTITGITSFFRGISLYIFSLLVMQVFYLGLESKKDANTLTSYIDFMEVEKRFSGTLKIFAIAIWLYGALSYLGYYDMMYEWVTDFLSEEHVLGNATFTFGTIFLFLVILLVSSFLSNIIAYIVSSIDQRKATSRKNRLGSSVLLIRLSIIIIGFFIALTAAKIPLDRITIVLGALSVGIGFGLQTIINNLVSGIILAFERPIQIGDEIEVGMNKGTVKEVGIRASKILSYDGSEIVVPNGDLLSQSLINWTLSDKRRRIELIIGVSYESDMKKVKTLLTDALIKNNILKSPPPRVFMQNFGDSSVDFRLLFWVESMDVWLEIRSDVMTSIFEIFKENGVEIPYPKRDLYLKSLPFGWKETITKPKNLSTDPKEEEDQKE